MTADVAKFSKRYLDSKKKLTHAHAVNGVYSIKNRLMLPHFCVKWRVFGQAYNKLVLALNFGGLVN